MIHPTEEQVSQFAMTFQHYVHVPFWEVVFSGQFQTHPPLNKENEVLQLIQTEDDEHYRQPY